jgi:polysaccharide pyruvyl transferase WcaK-like protein
VEAWAADLAREVDVTLGLRLHGNILALQQGRPALMLVADARMREMAEAFRMPAVEVSDLDPARVSLSALVEGFDFAGFVAAQRAGLVAYRAFLEENGIAHRLPALTPGDENA